MDKEKNKEALSHWADILKSIGNPTRLCIVCRLMNEDLNVSQMQDCLNAPQSTVSQNLSILKSAGIIKGNRKGSQIIYSLVDENIKQIIKVILSDIS